jgi:hypothetical protein
MDEQQKIQRQIDSVKILSAILDIGNGALWTAEIIQEYTGLDRDSSKTAIQYLQNKGLLSIYRGAYSVTEDGKEYFAGACTRPEIRTNFLQWKADVLSGLTEERSRRHKWMVTRETEISNAALPGAPCYPSNDITPEDLMSDKELEHIAKKTLADGLGIGIAEYDRRMAEGSIRLCEYGGEKHMGIFHKKGPNRWQPICRDCRSKKRSKKNGH